MPNRKSIYSLNKTDNTAIIYTETEGSTIRLFQRFRLREIRPP